MHMHALTVTNEEERVLDCIITLRVCTRGYAIGFVCRLPACMSVCLLLAQKKNATLEDLGI